MRERKLCSLCAAAWRLHEFTIQHCFLWTWHEASSSLCPAFLSTSIRSLWKKGLPFSHFLGDNGLEGTGSAGTAGTIYLLWRGRALLRGRGRFCWVSTVRTSWSAICLHTEVLCWIIAQGSQLPALRFLIKNKTAFLEAAHVLWAESFKVPLIFLIIPLCLPQKNSIHCSKERYSLDKLYGKNYIF